MAWAASTGTVASANTKTAGSTFTTGAITAAIGHTIFVVLTFDNVAAGTPTVNGLTVPSGETASWALAASHNSSSGTAAGGVRSELWVIRPTQAWTAFSPVATLSASVAAKASCGVVKQGGLPYQRTDTPPTGATSATSLPSFILQASTGALPVAGDLVIGFAGFETATLPTADADTTSGSWTTEKTNGTTGTTDNTNVSQILQSKIVTATAAQTYNPTNAVSTDAGASAAAFVVGPTVESVARVHAETLIQPTPAAQVSRVHAEALIQQAPATAQVQRVHVEVLVKARAGALLGRASTTDTARPLTRRVKKTLGRIVETDTARHLSSATVVPLHRVTETETARHFTATQRRVVGRVTETETARHFIATQRRVVGRVAETGTARQLTVTIHGVNVPLSRATETDTARSLRAAVTVHLGRISETTTAHALNRARQLGRASEADTARHLSTGETGGETWWDGTTEADVTSTWWDGTTEAPLDLSWWDGSIEQPVG